VCQHNNQASGWCREVVLVRQSCLPHVILVHDIIVSQAQQHPWQLLLGRVGLGGGSIYKGYAATHTDTTRHFDALGT
jgi:hypothetical protein